jgi:hypothetical protein
LPLDCPNSAGAAGQEWTGAWKPPVGYGSALCKELAIIAPLVVFRITPLKGTMLEKRLEELKAEREPLFRRLSSNPNETHLALEIKLIDDQIAECNHLIKQQAKART